VKNLILRFFKGYDWFLLGSVIFLCAIGLAVLFSTTFEVNWSTDAAKQVFFMGLGLALMFVLSRIDYRIYKSYTGILYIIVVLLLAFLAVASRFGLVGGIEAKGAVRWINLGFFQFQPSLLSQLLMAIILAKYFADNYEALQNFKAVFKSAVYVGIPTLLVAIQPDLGSALVFVFMWGLMLMLSNAKRIYIAVMLVVGLASLPVLWQFLKDYQRDRVLTFLNPTADPMGTGWNVKQAMIAIGSGQMWGRGLGRGTQSQLNFIPEKHTDFIFASLAEELGFIGVSITIGLFAVIFYRGIRIAVLARDFFGTYLAVGLLSIIFIHVFVNIGMNMGVLPVTGIPLPYISYGGTPILVDLAAIGLLQSIYRKYKKISF
jgi:rod shape determining protein RodA